MKHSGLAAGVTLGVLLLVGSATAGLNYNSIGTLDAGWHIGDGMSADQFTIWRDDEVEFGLKAHARGVGDLPQADGVYTASPGVSHFGGIPGATWNFNVSVLLAQPEDVTPNWDLIPGLAIVTGDDVDGFQTFAVHKATLFVDRDPAFDSRDAMPGAPGDGRSAINLTALLSANLASINTEFGTDLTMWNIAGFQLSENVLFDWVQNAAGWTEPFDPYAPGSYEFSLLVNSTPKWVDMRVQAVAVPVPGAMLLGIFGVGLTGLRLRRHS